MNCCDSPREERRRLQAGPRLQAASAVQTTSGRRHKGTEWVLSEEQPREEACGLVGQVSLLGGWETLEGNVFDSYS